MITTDWVAVATLDQIPPGGAQAYEVRGEQVAIFRLRSGTLRAVSAVCPHKGGPIADGQADEKVVLCPLHLNAFDLATGCSPTGAAPLTSYEVDVDDAGTILVGAARPPAG